MRSGENRPRVRLTGRRLPSIVSAAMLVAGVAGQSIAASADQTASSEPLGFYSPKGSQQSPPLRVEVLEGVKFRDIETGDVYRLYGIDACAPTQRATLGRQPWPCGVMATAWLVSATLGKWVACARILEGDGVIQARCASSQPVSYTH